MPFVAAWYGEVRSSSSTSCRSCTSFSIDGPGEGFFLSCEVPRSVEISDETLWENNTLSETSVRIEAEKSPGGSMKNPLFAVSIGVSMGKGKAVFPQGGRLGEENVVKLRMKAVLMDEKKAAMRLKGVKETGNAWMM